MTNDPTPEDMALVPVATGVAILGGVEGKPLTPIQAWNEVWASQPEHPVTLWLRNQPRDATRAAYAEAAGKLAAFLVHDPLTTTFSELLAYRDHLMGGQYAHSTVDSHLNRVSALYAFLVEQGLLERDPSKGLKWPKPRDSRSKRAWELSDLAGFFGQIPRDGRLEHLRDWAMFWLMFRNGLRVSEVVGATVGNLTIKSGLPVLELVEARPDDQHVKGGHARDAVLKSETFADIRAYLEARGIGEGMVVAGGVGEWRTAPLFAATKLSGRARAQAGPFGRPLSRFTVIDRMALYAERAGLDPALVYPHAARRTFTTWLTRKGVPMNEIMAATGHRKLETVQRYLDMHVALHQNAALKLDY